MACIFIGIVAVIRSLVQRSKKTQIVPGSAVVGKASLEHDGKDRGDAKVGGHSRVLRFLQHITVITYTKFNSDRKCN